MRIAFPWVSGTNADTNVVVAVSVFKRVFFVAWVIKVVVCIVLFLVAEARGQVCLCVLSVSASLSVFAQKKKRNFT